jgi:hypothetical protein
MTQTQGIEGEAVPLERDYEPFITQEMGYDRLSRRVNE